MIAVHADDQGDNGNARAHKNAAAHPADKLFTRQERAAAMFKHARILTRERWIQKRFCPYYLDVQKLPREFYDRKTVMVARDLLGKLLVHVNNGVERIGKIVETEAYLGPHDLAAHSSKGLTT